MQNKPWKSKKVAIVGAGDVGATFAYALAQSGVADEIAMIDINEDLLAGQVLDLSHGLPYYPPIRIYEGDEEDYRDARVIIITAGASFQRFKAGLNCQSTVSFTTRFVRLGKSFHEFLLWRDFL